MLSIKIMCLLWFARNSDQFGKKTHKICHKNIIKSHVIFFPLDGHKMYGKVLKCPTNFAHILNSATVLLRCINIILVPDGTIKI